MTTHDFTTPTEIGAALDAAQPGAQVVPHRGPDRLLLVATRPGHTTVEHDLERYLPAPARQRGTVRALTADGFVDAFQTRTEVDSPAAVYADVDTLELVAVLNDDQGAGTGWRDHRITYNERWAPEWRHWLGRQGLGSQERFAETIDDGETEIREPSATQMLEIAETFHASTSAKFKQAGRQRDGRVQLAYEEEIEASAGDGGLVAIPETFTIEVRPFYGAQPRMVTCRLRFRLTKGELAIGYKIHRPDEIVRDAFLTDVVGHIRGALSGFPVIEANPAAPRA